MSNQDKEIIKLHLQLVSLRVEHALSRCSKDGALVIEDIMDIVNYEIEKELKSIDTSKYANL